MDRLFPEAEIKFDLMHGGYSPTVKAERAIILYTDNPILKHWTQNALNRHGFLCLEKQVAPEDKKLPELKVLSPSEIHLHIDEKNYSCGSFGELISILS